MRKTKILSKEQPIEHGESVPPIDSFGCLLLNVNLDKMDKVNAKHENIRKGHLHAILKD